MTVTICLTRASGNVVTTHLRAGSPQQGSEGDYDRAPSASSGSVATQPREQEANLLSRVSHLKKERKKEK